MILSIWNSFRALPQWVQIWVALILAPLNMASLFFIDQPLGMLVAFLAIVGLAPNIAIILMEKGFSKLMAFPHIPPWSILVAILVFTRPDGSSEYQIFLWVLLVINTISLWFDFFDAYKWLRGDRKIAGA